LVINRASAETTRSANCADLNRPELSVHALEIEATSCNTILIRKVNNPKNLLRRATKRNAVGALTIQA
jgi:hypothetical protein